MFHDVGRPGTRVQESMKAIALGGIALLALSPSAARAQDATPESPTQSGKPGQATHEPESQSAGPVAETPRPPRWLASIGARQSWDTNPRFSETEIQGSWITGLNGQLAYSERFARGSLAIVGDGGMVRYSDAQGLNEFVYAGRAIGAWKPSSRLDLAMDQSYSSSYTHQNQALVDSGLVLAQAVVQRLGTTVTAARRLAARTSLTGLVRYEHVSFPNGDLVNGDEFTAGFGFTRQLSRSDNLSLNYSYLKDSVPTQTIGASGSNDIHTLTAGWSRQLAERWTTSLSGGVATFTPVGAASRSWEPQGAATIERKARRWTLGGHYSRSVGQAFGLGRQRVADVVGTTVAMTLTRSLSADAIYTRSWNKDPADTQYSFNDDAVGADLRWTLFRRLVTTGSYSYRRSTGQAGAVGALAGNVWALSMSYVQQWQ